MSAYSRDIGADSSWPVEATRRMNRMYRRQRHIYDGTRRYYLLGRDQMIAGLRLDAGARLSPTAPFFGIEVSTEMFASAIAAISRAGLAGHVRVAHGDASSFDAKRLFGIPQFDHVMISYSLSMIPDWRGVLRAAAAHLKPGRRLHGVDFGGQERLPGITRML